MSLETLKKQNWKEKQKITILEALKNAIEKEQSEVNMSILRIIGYEDAQRIQRDVKNVLEELQIDGTQVKDSIVVDEDSRYSTVFEYHMKILISDIVKSRVRELLS